MERRLAAILAADVAGYSRLMGIDDEGTHKDLKAHCQQLVEPKSSNIADASSKTQAMVFWRSFRAF